MNLRKSSIQYKLADGAITESEDMMYIFILANLKWTEHSVSAHNFRVQTVYEHQKMLFVHVRSMNLDYDKQPVCRKHQPQDNLQEMEEV